MTTNTYALSRSERAWLMTALAFLVSAMFYRQLASRVVSGQPGDVLTSMLQNMPVLMMICLCGGFMLTAVGHYAVRQTFVKPASHGVAHD
ncbi:hypothetical protein [Siccibacter turicensis]|uniref:hypothetical protein n=1 Tax=Siccibacter TaxID=1649298 RepID=UPI000464EB0C|nr:hypothetical protein [Siccibacter turicensis]